MIRNNRIDKQLNTKMTTPYGVENSCPGLRQAQKVNAFID
jgi:hypothetical protein